MSFFEKRADLHTKIYSHKTSIAASFMISDVLCLADPFIEIPVGKECSGATLPPSRAMLDPYAMLRLKDSVIDLIASRTDIPGLRPAQKLLQRYQKRDIYKCVASKYLDTVGSASHRSIWGISEKDIAHEIMSAAQTSAASYLEEEFSFLEKPVVHGERGYMVASHLCQEPSTDSLPEAFKVDETGYPFPSSFQKTVIHVYSKTEDKRMPVSNAFKRWWSEISNAAQDPLQSTRSAESSALLEDDFTGFNNDCTSENGSLLATSQSEVKDMPSSSLARMLTQESDDEDDDENLDFDARQQCRFESDSQWMSSR
jgi:hypothetical protein